MDDKERTPLVHVRKILESKNPRLARLIPRFITNWISRIIHEDEINTILRENGDKHDLEFLEAVIRYFNVTLLVHGEENLPAEGHYIFAGNHPLGGFDGILLLGFLGRRYKQVKALSNDILMNLKNLDGLFIPINKHGSNSKDAARILDGCMRSDMQILTFPAGLVSRKISGHIMDLEWKKNFIQKSVKYQRDIIPFHVSGRNTERFYRLANLRKWFRISWNLEMFFLPDETFRHKHKSFTITFGKPIPYSQFDHSREAAGWANWVKEQVYALPEQIMH